MMVRNSSLFFMRKMEVRLGEDVHILQPGDSIYYDSTVPHLVKCHGKDATKILAVLNAGK